MTYIADRFVVVLDACVLYPFRMRDILLSFFQKGMFRARWTDEIIAEWTTAVIADKPHMTASIQQQQEAMRRHFDEAWVHGYEPLIGQLELPDPKDRHVLAAAIRCGAQHIVTDNLKDFPLSALEQYDIEAISADEFLTRTFDLYTAASVEVLSQVRVRYIKQQFSPSEFVMDLTAKNMPKLAARAREHRALL